jgi:hypothetical protein
MPNILESSNAVMARQNAALNLAPASGSLGALPEWDLSDLYPGIGSEAFRADLARAEADCKAMAEAYRGKLEELAKRPDAATALGEAVQRYETVEDLLGRLMSYAGLVYSGDTTDPVRAKFYGDTQERLTAASSDLLFFTLELNRIDDTVMDKAMASPPLSHYRPWIEDLRKDKPYQLDDQLEKLFHEKSVTGRSAWNRLFDETIASLRPSRRICAPSRSSPIRSRRTRRSRTGGAVSRMSRTHDIWRTGSSPKSSRPWSRPCARPIRACRTATTP